jgi:hypothetical protein
MRGQKDQNGWATPMPFVGLVALMLMAFISVTVFAQETSPKPQEQPASKFKVDSYIPKKFVDLQWKASGSFFGNGYDEDHNASRESSNGIGKSEFRHDGQQVNFSTSAGYRHETIPGSWGLDLGVGVNHSHDNQRLSSTSNYPYSDGPGAESRNHSTYFDLVASPSTTGNVYLRSDAFVSFSGSSFLRYSDASYHRDTTYEVGENLPQYTYRSSTDQRSYYVNFAIEPGWGRVYEGIYAATAIFIINELRTNGLVQNEPTVSDMQQLTETIYQFRLKHAIDYRSHKIEATQAITDYLVSAGIISEGQTRRFFLIEDIWSYMPTVARAFGFKTHIGIGTDYRYNSSQQSAENSQPTYQHSVTSENHPYIIASVEFHRPVDLQWQLDCNLALRSYFNDRATRMNEHSQYSFGARNENRYRDKYGLQGNATINYIPTTRTRGSLSNTVTHNHYDLEAVSFPVASPIATRNERSDQFRIWSYGTDARISYRISLPIELTFVASYSYLKETTTRDGLRSDNSSGGYTFQVGVAYYII